MRLTCPNCGARYEVDAAMIPPEGRDVQCSNCTTTWFQPGFKRDSDVSDPAPPPESPAEPPVEAEPEVAARELDPEVQSVLREEAQREAALRRQESGAIEVQGEIPLDAADDDQDYEIDEEDAALAASVSGLMASAAEMEDLQDAPRERARDEARSTYAGTDEVEAAMAAAAAAAPPQVTAQGSRRDLLPDIEEINSTLRATGERRPGTADGSDVDTVADRPRRRGTRLGFGMALLLFAALIAVYANSDRINQAVPALQPAVDGYVGQVERLRSWIDMMAQGALEDNASAATPTLSPEIAAPTPDPQTPSPAADQAETDAAPNPAAETAGTGAVPVVDTETPAATE
ncbi:MAG: zinc-ribbon domain-containing protein [Pseudomonadota bacterium]